MTTVVLVSGTRWATWEHMPLIDAHLRPLVEAGPGVLVHGDGTGGSPQHIGVDRLAASAARDWGWQTVPVPARWHVCDLTVPRDLGGCPDWVHRKRNRAGHWYCGYAGNRRNQQMVQRMPRADHVVVFPAGSIEARSGTRDLWTRAIRGGLHVLDPIPLEVDRG